jgi:hypothetical protein
MARRDKDKKPVDYETQKKESLKSLLESESFYFANIIKNTKYGLDGALRSAVLTQAGLNENGGLEKSIETAFGSDLEAQMETSALRGDGPTATVSVENVRYKFFKIFEEHAYDKLKVEDLVNEYLIPRMGPLQIDQDHALPVPLPEKSFAGKTLNQLKESEDKAEKAYYQLIAGNGKDKAGLLYIAQDRYMKQKESKYKAIKEVMKYHQSQQAGES